MNHPIFVFFSWYKYQSLTTIATSHHWATTGGFIPEAPGLFPNGSHMVRSARCETSTKTEANQSLVEQAVTAKNGPLRSSVPSN